MVNGAWSANKDVDWRGEGAVKLEIAGKTHAITEMPGVRLPDLIRCILQLAQTKPQWTALTRRSSGGPT